jgi:hypothetical protein
MLEHGVGWRPKNFVMIPKGSLKSYQEKLEAIVVEPDRRSTIASNSSQETKSTIASNSATLTEAEHQLYQAMVKISFTFNLDRLRLSKDERFLADATGRTPANVHKTLAQLDRKSCIVRHERSRPRWKASTYAIVGASETREVVLRLLGLNETQLAERLKPPSRALQIAA